MPPARRQAGWIAIGGAGQVDESPVVVRVTPGEWAEPNPTVPDPASLVPTVRRALFVSSCHQHLSPEQVGTARAEVQNHTHRHPVHGLLLDIVTPNPRQSSQSPRQDTAKLHGERPAPRPTQGASSIPTRVVRQLLAASRKSEPFRRVPGGDQNDWTADKVRSPAPSRPSSLMELHEVRLILLIDCL